MALGYLWALIPAVMLCPLLVLRTVWEDQMLREGLAGYEERSFDRMPELADALEGAGCHVPDILGHCRQAGPHARGCWVVDAILGKS